MLESIKKLVSINGVSGSERPVTEYIKSQVTPYADKVYTDVMGNLVAIKRGSGKKILGNFFIFAKDQFFQLMITHIFLLYQIVYDCFHIPHPHT